MSVSVGGDRPTPPHSISNKSDSILSAIPSSLLTSPLARQLEEVTSILFDYGDHAQAEAKDMSRNLDDKLERGNNAVERCKNRQADLNQLIPSTVKAAGTLQPLVTQVGSLSQSLGSILQIEKLYEEKREQEASRKQEYARLEAAALERRKSQKRNGVERLFDQKWEELHMKYSVA